MRKLKWKVNTFVLLIITFFSSSVFAQPESSSNLTLDLETAIELTLAKNGLLKSSELEIEIAKTQNGQASSANYPSLNLSSNIVYLDEDPNYIFPSFDFKLDGLELPVIGSLDIPPLTIPEQNVKLMNRFNIESTLKLVYPIFTGGKISSLISQTESNIRVASYKHDLIKQELIYNTSKAYWGCVLLNNLELIGDEALARLEATLELTESLYKKGSGSVTKLDYLQNKIIVESARGLIESIRGKKGSSVEALKFLVGVTPESTVSLTSENLESNIIIDSLDLLKNKLLQNNPQLKMVDAALNIFSEKINEAESELYPNIALFGFYKKTINSYDAGYVTNDNKNQFGVGVGLEFPIFEGLRSTYKIDQTEIELHKLQTEKTLLTQSLIMKLRSLHIELVHASKKLSAVRSAMDNAVDNCNLSKRAYQNDMAPIEDYIQSQLMESIMKAQFHLAEFEVVDLKLQLNKLVSQ